MKQHMKTTHDQTRNLTIGHSSPNAAAALASVLGQTHDLSATIAMLTNEFRERHYTSLVLPGKDMTDHERFSAYILGINESTGWQVPCAAGDPSHTCGAWPNGCGHHRVHLSATELEINMQAHLRLARQCIDGWEWMMEMTEAERRQAVETALLEA